MSSEHLFIISQIKLPELLPDARNEIPDTRYFWKFSARARPMPEHAQKYPLDARKIDARPFPIVYLKCIPRSKYLLWPNFYFVCSVPFQHLQKTRKIKNNLENYYRSGMKKMNEAGSKIKRTFW